MSAAIAKHFAIGALMVTLRSPRISPMARTLRCVAPVEHQLVAVGVCEERHVTDARVECVAEELHALGLERRTHFGHVVAAQGPRIAFLRDERPAHLLGLQIPKHVWPAHCSHSAWESGRMPRTSR